MPFTLEQFLDVFRRYNDAIWPAQLGLGAVGLSLAAFVRASASAQRYVAVVLAFLWAWSGAVYHLAFFATINPAARIFGGAFLVQSVLWLVWMVRERPQLAALGDARTLVAGALLLYALAVYPALNTVLGHPYPTMPTFGAPCPTTIASFAVLASARARPPWWLWIIPVLWACVGTVAALSLGVREDLGLPIGACAAIAVQFVRRAPIGPASRPIEER